MANKEHLDILRQGVEEWNSWRKKHQYIQPDFSDANLNTNNLSGIDFSRANLYAVNLNRANLNNAIFNKADLSRANLSRADLNDADFTLTHLALADFRGAYLNKADFSYSRLYSTCLALADLTEADLTGTDIMGADFSDANLSRANLTGVNFNNANLTGANLTGATVGQTTFGNVDLQNIEGLDNVYHVGPSYISTNALERSEGNIPEVFLRGAGLSDPFIEYVYALVGHPFEYYSCFICYSHEDEKFARRLYIDLQSNGVRCWFDKKDLKIGDFHRYRIDESIKVHDKTLLILSEHSIKSTEVKEEVEKVWKKEEQMDMSMQVLFPIRLDDTVMYTTRSWVATLRHLRHIGNFTQWKNHDAYQEAFQELLNNLKAEKKRKR